MIGLSERGKVGTVKKTLQRTVTKEMAPIEQSKPITNMRIYTLIHKVE